MQDAVTLYYRAIALWSDEYPLLKARATVGMATALRTIPAEGTDLLMQAKAGDEAAMPVLQKFASPSAYYQEAWEIFTQYGQIEQAKTVAQALQEIANG